MLKMWAGKQSIRLTSFSKRAGSALCWLAQTWMYWNNIREKERTVMLDRLHELYVHVEIKGPIRTYLTSMVRMLYVRDSSLSSVMVQVPGSRAVWTSSFNAVRRVPSCSVTAFSIGSCSPPVWVASSTCDITGVLAPSPGRDAPVPTVTASVWKGFSPGPDFSEVLWLFLLAMSQSTSSSTLSTCDRTSSCRQEIKNGEGAEHTVQTDSSANEMHPVL